MIGRFWNSGRSWGDFGSFQRMQLETTSSEEAHIFLHVNLLPPGTGYEVCLAHLEFFLQQRKEIIEVELQT
jgi:hypothetical protein